MSWRSFFFFLFHFAVDLKDKPDLIVQYKMCNGTVVMNTTDRKKLFLTVAKHPLFASHSASMLEKKQNFKQIDGILLFLRNNGKNLKCTTATILFGSSASYRSNSLVVKRGWSKQVYYLLWSHLCVPLATPLRHQWMTSADVLVSFVTIFDHFVSVSLSTCFVLLQVQPFLDRIDHVKCFAAI